MQKVLGNVYEVARRIVSVLFSDRGEKANFLGEGFESSAVLAEGDEGAVDRVAGLFGGGEEFAGAALEIEVGIITREPAVCEEVLVEFVAAQALRVQEGEAGADDGCMRLRGPGAAGGGAALVFAGPMAEVGLRPAEDTKEEVSERGVESWVESAHGLAEELAE